MLQCQCCMRACDELVRLPKARRFEQNRVYFGKADKGFQQASIHFEHTCTVSADRGEEILKQIIDVQPSNKYLLTLLICLPARPAGLTPACQRSHSTANHINSGTWIVDGR